MKYHVSAFSGPENDSFARRSATDSRINIRIGTTAAQKWDVSVFVPSTERPGFCGNLASFSKKRCLVVLFILVPV